MVIDSERDSPTDPMPNDRQQTLDNCRKVGVTCHVTERRGTENYVPHAIVKSHLPGAPDLGDFGHKMEWKPFHYSETKHGPAMAADMSKADLLATDIGQFLKSL